MEASPVNHWNVETAFAQLEKCGFACDGGPLSMSDAYIWLKRALMDVGPKFLPGQGVYFKVTAEAAGVKMDQWVHFYIVGVSMSSDTERRFWTYDLSYDPPAPYHYGTVHFRDVKGDALRLEPELVPTTNRAEAM